SPAVEERRAAQIAYKGSLSWRVLLRWLKHSDVLSRVLLIQIATTRSPCMEPASQIADPLEPFRFQIVCDHERKPAAGTHHKDVLVPWKLIHAFRDRVKRRFVRIRQTFPFLTVVRRAYIQDICLLIKQKTFV